MTLLPRILWCKGTRRRSIRYRVRLKEPTRQQRRRLFPTVDSAALHAFTSHRSSSRNRISREIASSYSEALDAEQDRQLAHPKPTVPIHVHVNHADTRSWLDIATSEKVEVLEAMASGLSTEIFGCLVFVRAEYRQRHSASTPEPRGLVKPLSSAPSTTSGGGRGSRGAGATSNRRGLPRLSGGDVAVGADALG